MASPGLATRRTHDGIFICSSHIICNLPSLGFSPDFGNILSSRRYADDADRTQLLSISELCDNMPGQYIITAILTL